MVGLACAMWICILCNCHIPAFLNLQVWQVTDTGMGLNPQDIPSLFNKFLHADSTTTRNYGGTGLGLAICKRYCQCGQLESLVLVNFAGMLVVCT